MLFLKNDPRTDYLPRQNAYLSSSSLQDKQILSSLDRPKYKCERKRHLKEEILFLKRGASFEVAVCIERVFADHFICSNL